jgi:hypothetical protein
MLDGANPGLALRCGGISGIINPCASKISESGLRFACSSVASRYLTGSTQPPKAKAAVSQLATMHRRDQAIIAVGSG